MSTCRVCKKTTYDPHTYPMVRYGPRHYAHADCGLRRDGAEFIQKLNPCQLGHFPYMAAVEAGYEKQLVAAYNAHKTGKAPI